MIQIRKYKKEDCYEISEIIKECLINVNSKDYPKTVIDFMIDHFSPQQIDEYGKINICLVAVENEKIIGTISLNKNVIYTTFVHPAYYGKGIGSSLLEKLEEIASGKGYKELHVPASLSAVDFYKKCGFIEQKEDYDENFGKTILMKKELV